MRTARALILSLLAVFAFSAVAAGAAQAAEPYWSIAGKKLEAGKTEKLTAKSGLSRLWSTGAGIVIVCKSDEVTGGALIGGEPGKDEAASIKYKECLVYAAKKETGKWEVGELLSGCKVKSPGEEVLEGELVTKGLSSQIAYYPKSVKPEQNKLYYVVYFTPKTEELFIEIELKGSSCVAKGKYKVTGSVVGTVLPLTFPAGEIVEAASGWLGFWVHENAEKEMVNYPEAYETAGGKTEPDTLKFGANAAAYEGVEEIGLEGESFGIK